MDEEEKLNTTPPEDAPLDVAQDEPAPEENPEETPEEPAPETPTPAEPSEDSPVEPANPDLIAQAEAETPAEVTPAFDASNQPKKSKKVLAFILLAVFLLAGGGFSAWYFLLRGGNNEPSSSQVSNNKQETPTPEPNANELTLVGNDLSDFDISFLKLENDGKNKVYSPLSIKYALAMLKDATSGDSKTQIESLIGNYQPKAYLNSANRSLANALFIKNEFTDKIKPTYIDGLKLNYNAEVLFDELVAPTAVNNWVEDKTLGIIKNLVSEDSINPSSHTKFVLVNALAIDMEWDYRLQCVYDDAEGKNGSGTKCKTYGANFLHEKYSDYVRKVDTANPNDGFDKISFNGSEVEAAELAVSANRYDVVSENGGEEAVRTFVQQKFDEWLQDAKARYADCGTDCYSEDFNLDEYMTELKANYDKIATSTNFYFLDNDDERVFAKDLKEYDGATLQYIGIMPKTSSLTDYIKSLTAEKAASLISSMRPASEASGYKDGVLTKVRAHIPFFKFNEGLNLVDDLKSLNITDVFDENKANLTNLTDEPSILITDAVHKADIDFSNDGIKAAAATALVGGAGAGGYDQFDYLWEIPVEEADLTFDKPFLFLIRDKSSGEVWFAGSVYNPALN